MAIETATGEQWIRVASIASSGLLTLLLSSLHRGEADAIALGVELQAGIVLMDEQEGRQTVTRAGLKITLPLGPGVPARQSHDDVRHGVTSLFTALNTKTGATIAACHRRHRHQEFLRFLNKINASVPAGVDVHIVMDNYGTHKVDKV
jgi:hypothetical protein